MRQPCSLERIFDRYHYLDYKPLPGAQLRDFAWSDEGLLALFGFGAAAWKTASRDNFIGLDSTYAKSFPTSHCEQCSLPYPSLDSIEAPCLKTFGAYC